MSILKAEKLQAGYENHIVFQDLDFAVSTGKITTIIGPNGCGKSTLLKTMGRILKPRQGAVYLQGQDLSRLDTKMIARKLALLPQSPAAPGELKVEELVSYGRFPHRRRMQQPTANDQAIIEWAMEVTQVAPYRQRKIGNLSGGERQKVWLSMALAQETQILLLDEPTTYLDMSHQLEVLKIVEQLNRRQQCTVVMVLHDINHAARFSHEIVAMREGAIIASGTPMEVITPEVLRRVFQIEARVMIDEHNGAPVCFSYDTI
jgi:iron complex transport system ATP-binding protein